MGGARNALEIYDPKLARKQQQLAAGPVYQPTRPPEGYKLPELSAETKKKLADAVELESKKIRQREEERRKRDPTYNPNAIEV